MQSLPAHCRALPGLDDSSAVTNVDLSLAEKRVVISLEFTSHSAIPECGAACPLKDHAPGRQWQHPNRMQFEPARLSQNCLEHGMRNMARHLRKKADKATAEEIPAAEGKQKAGGN